MKRFLKKFSARFFISMGLVSLLTSLLFLAFFFEIIPNKDATVMQGRTALAESIAIFSTSLISLGDVEPLQTAMGFVVDRNPDLLSAAIRNPDDQILAAFGEHQKYWHGDSDKQSTETDIKVPIYEGDQIWGQVELAFKPLKPDGLLGLLYDSRVQLSLFLSITGFLTFYFYMGRMLKHLDPSRAVPERVRSALDTLTEGLLVIDIEGNIVLANQSFTELFGREQNSFTGLIANALPWENAEGKRPNNSDYPWQQALKKGAPIRNSMLWLTDVDDKRRSFMINCSPILVGKGEYGGVMVSLDDVTLLEEKEIELRKSQQEAEAANQAKSEFLANMSHEIRSPMNAILGFTELLRRGQAKNETEFRRQLDIVHASGAHLLGLINDILDLSKVESGRMEIEHITCSPYQIAYEVVQAQGVKAHEKGIAIELDCPGELPATIVTDAGRLRQILTNLIGNAIKFTSEGGIMVTLRLLPTKPDARLQFDVADSGIGIADDKLDSVFEPFVQAEGSITRRFGGTGLGLTISRRFARLMGGDITATSMPGAGSTFTVNLPAGALDQITLLMPDEIARQQAAQTTIAGSTWRLPRARVLIVDDGEENRELLRLLLEDAGALTEQAENGRIAVEKTLTQAYDLILMDLQMPEMDGETATRLLRERGLKTPIVALTAHAMKGFEEHILGTGCTAYLTKPLDLDKLMSLVANLIGGEQVTAASDHAESHISAYQPGSASKPAVISRLAGNARLRPAVEKFVLRLDEQLAAMAQALAAKDYKTLADLAHWLKGAAGSVGFDTYTEPAKELELLAKAGSENGIDEVLDVLRGLTSRIAWPEANNTSNAQVKSIHAEPLTAALNQPRAILIANDKSDNISGPAVISRLAGNVRLRPALDKFVIRLDEQLAAMEQAWQARDHKALADLAHWLKGAAGSVGFDVYTEPAQELEQLAKAGSEYGIDKVIAELRDLTSRIAWPEADNNNQEPLKS